MIRTYQRRHKGASGSQPDNFSPFESDSQDLVSSYHSAISSQEGNASLDFAHQPRGSSQPPPRLGSLSSRLDLFAFDDDEDEGEFGHVGPPAKQESATGMQMESGSQGGSPTKKAASKPGDSANQLSDAPGRENSQALERGPQGGGLAKSPLLAGSFGRGVWQLSPAVQSSSLMEHQESGEMQESVDEAKFALEGLAPGSSIRVLRASLVALAQLLSSSNRRRVLQAHGLGKPLLTKILTLPCGESLLRLASAAVVYFLSVDDQAHRSLLDSDDVIRLVLGFLGGGEEGDPSNDGGKVAAEQLRRVQELFRGEDGAVGGLTGGQKVTPEWLGLLALEQASLAAAQLEQEASIGGAKSPNHFKDRLREQGGLAAVCHLAAGCHVSLRDDVTADVTSTAHATMLLRCLRVLEHVTYVSEENQRHLLQLRLSGGALTGVIEGGGKKEDGASGTGTCVGVVLGCIEVLAQGGVKRRGLAAGREGGAKDKGDRDETERLEEKKPGLRLAEKRGALARAGSDAGTRRGKLSSAGGKDSVRSGTRGAESGSDAEKAVGKRQEKPVGKWQSAAKVKCTGSRKFREDEIIPDSDEETEKDSKPFPVAFSSRTQKASEPGRGHVADGKKGHVADGKMGHVADAGGDSEGRITRRTSGRFAKVTSGIREHDAMDVVRDSADEAVSSDDVRNDDVINLRTRSGPGRPPLVRTFSRKKRKVEEEPGEGVSKSKLGRGPPEADPFNFELDVEEPRKGEQTKGKRKVMESGNGSTFANIFQRPGSDSESTHQNGRKIGNGDLDRKSSLERKNGASTPIAATRDGSDLEMLEDAIAPSLGSAPRRVDDRTAFNFDKSDGGESSAAALGRGRAPVKRAVKDDPVLLGTSTRDASSGDELRPPEPTGLRKEKSVRSAFAFNPVAEDRERKQLATGNETETEVEKGGPLRDCHVELDKGLVTDCLVTSVKVLMNLTNDNADGCQQIAAAGGLHSIAAILVARCPPGRSQTVSTNGLRSAPCETAPGSATSGDSAGGPTGSKTDQGRVPGASVRGLKEDRGEKETARERKPAKGLAGFLEADGCADDVSVGADMAADVSTDADVAADVGRVAAPSEDLDLVTVVLALLVNLVEKDRGNCAALAALDFPVGRGSPGGSLKGGERTGMVACLCALFLSKKGAGAKAESVENDVAALEMDDETRLAEGQREAEDMIVEAYAALLLALLAKEDVCARKTVAETLPEGDASSLVPVLERFMNFHLTMNTFTSEAHEALLALIEACKSRGG